MRVSHRKVRGSKRQHTSEGEKGENTRTLHREASRSGNLQEEGSETGEKRAGETLTPVLYNSGGQRAELTT